MGIYQGSKLMSGGGGGPSPYEIAKQNGYTGTESEFNQLLAALDQNATKEETNRLLQNKAPAGYGSFGETLEHFELDDSDGTLLKAKIIEIANTIGANNTYRFTFSAYPFVTGWPYFATVATMNNSNGERRILLDASSIVGYGFRLYYMENSNHIDEWTDVIWYDPPMSPNQIYCTYEHSGDQLVYKKMDSNGVIWWSTDQSTWKREAERVGAYSKIESDALLQKKAPAGYGLGNDSSKRLTSSDNLDEISGSGWYFWYDNVPAGAPDTYCTMRVDTGYNGSLFWCHQHIWKAGGNEERVRGFLEDGSAWSEWEWVNPPMELGKEYRTTERYLGKPVYCMTKFVGEVAANTVTQVIFNESDIGGYCIRAFCTGKRTFGNWDDRTTTMVSSPAGSETTITCDPTIYRINEGGRSIRTYIKSSENLKDVYCTVYYTKWAD